jgi:hypothetical protein
MNFVQDDRLSGQANKPESGVANVERSQFGLINCPYSEGGQ